MSDNINRVVSVSLVGGGKSLSRTNMNIVTIITSEVGVLSSANRTKAYSDIGSVASDFGTNSKMYNFAKTLFAQPKNPANSGGYLVASYWRAVDETVAATNGVLKGSQLSESVVISTLQSVGDGSFSISIDNTEQSITGLDFRTIDSLEDIRQILDNNITDAVISIEDQRLIITSNSSGAASEVTFLSRNSDTFVGDTLALASGTGAIVIDGEDEQTLAAEAKEEAIVKALEEEPFKGAVFIDNPTDTETEALAAWAESNNVIIYDVFDSSANLEKNINNICWKIKLQSSDNYRMMFRKDGDRKMAIAEMSINHTVNYNAQNSAKTLHLKELVSISSETYTTDELNKAAAVGLDVYANFGDVPKLLTSGANGYVDNVYNFIAIKNFVQIDVFNLLGTTITKLAQIDRDVLKIVDTIEKTLSLFLKANVIGAGVWNSPDSFGDVEVFKRNIKENGYYVLAQSLSEQAQSDREQRKAPVIQVAFKNAGAIHSVDVIINFEL